MSWINKIKEAQSILDSSEMGDQPALEINSISNFHIGNIVIAAAADPNLISKTCARLCQFNSQDFPLQFIPENKSPKFQENMENDSGGNIMFSSDIFEKNLKNYTLFSFLKACTADNDDNIFVYFAVRADLIGKLMEKGRLSVPLHKFSKILLAGKGEPKALSTYFELAYNFGNNRTNVTFL